MRNILVIDDDFSSIVGLKNIVKEGEYNLLPGNESTNKNLMKNVMAILGYNKSISKKEGRNFMENYISDNKIDGFILDYKLDGENVNPELTGVSFFEVFISKLYVDNCLFFTLYNENDSEYLAFDKYRKETNLSYTGKVELMTKDGLIDEEEKKLLIQIIRGLFPPISLKRY